MYSIENVNHMHELRKKLLSTYPILKSATVFGGISDGEISFPCLEIPHYRSVITSALQKAVRRQTPNQMEKAIALLLFLISSNPNERDRKALTTLMKKRLIVTAVEDAFCFVKGSAEIYEAWGKEGEINPDKLFRATRNLCRNGTCRYAHDKKSDKENPVVLASLHMQGSRNWKSLNPEVFEDLMRKKDSDNDSVTAIQNCILRNYKGKSQRIKNNKPVGDFTMLLLGIFLYRQNPNIFYLTYSTY